MEEIAKLLSVERSYGSIKTKAEKLGLKTREYWTEEEDDIIRKYYPNTTTPILKNDMYASKCGVIKSINISSGNVLVEPNEYVEEGQILVKSTITNSKGEEVYIGTQGRIYAYTWNIVEVEENNYVNEVESYVALLEKARRIVSHGFENEEKIDKEVILKYEVSENEMFLRIHYTCIENIAYCI